ncbi:chymotrypsin-like elastase family member 1, partial [Clytia hemisphaerica]
MLRLVAALGCLIVVAYACSDENSFCPYLAESSHNYCQTSSFVKKFCKKSCGTCPGGNGGNGGSGSNGQCGISKVSQSRVVNGVEAKPGAWPRIVSIQTGYIDSHFCGGTILTPNWVLTASHCVYGKQNNPGYFRMVAGVHDSWRPEGTQQKVGAKRVIMHPNYDRQTVNADVALIELSTPFRLNDRVVKACMPQEGVYPPAGNGSKCFIAGWGKTSHPRSSTRYLQQAELPVVQSPHEGCHYNEEVVCVGKGFTNQPDGSQQPNACRGDSGGPLMCQQSNGSWTVEGVASYVHTYCKYYTAYAPVNKYLPWIKQYVRD